MAFTAFLGFVQYSSMLSPSRQPANEPAMGYAGTRSATPPLYAATTRSRGVMDVDGDGGVAAVLMSVFFPLWWRGQHRPERVEGQRDLLRRETGAYHQRRHLRPGGVQPCETPALLGRRAEHDQLLEQLVGIGRDGSGELRR